MQQLKNFKSIFGRKTPAKKPSEGSLVIRSAPGSAPDLADGTSVPISLRQLETIALSSAKLAAIGPQLATVAGKMEKQANEQAKSAAEIARRAGILSEKLNEAMARLQDASVNVRSVIGDIARIADQTRILSINASIEASRAGEQGRAFNVVAQEVQQLAAQTHESTGKIEERVLAIQGSVHDLAATVTEKTSGVHVTANKSAAVTVESVNAEVQAMAASADGQRADAHSLRGLGEQANHLSEELLLSVGGFRLNVHRRAMVAVGGFLTDLAKNYGNRAELESLLLEWMEEHPEFELFYVTDSAGRQVVDNVGWKNGRPATIAGGLNRDWRDRLWFRNAMKVSDEVAVSDIYRSTATRDFCFTVSAVISGPDDNPLGVLGADVNFQRLVTGDLSR